MLAPEAREHCAEGGGPRCALPFTATLLKSSVVIAPWSRSDPSVMHARDPERSGTEPIVPAVRRVGAGASGAVRLLRSLDEANKLASGDVLVTHMTSPDWSR